jgi:hypothetical protein
MLPANTPADLQGFQGFVCYSHNTRKEDDLAAGYSLKQQFYFGTAWLAEEIGQEARCEADKRGIRAKVTVLQIVRNEAGIVTETLTVKM